MLSVTIDTAVFAPPAIDAPADDVHSFVATLLEWRDAMDDEHVDVYTSKFAPDVLMKCNLYPIRPQLKELLMHAHVFEYDANTIAVLAETLLRRSTKIETMLGIDDVLVDELTINPDVCSGDAPRRGRALRSRRLHASRYCNEPLIQGHAIAIRAQDFGAAVRVKGLLQDIQHYRDDLAGLPMAPEYFEGSALVCSSFHRLLMSLDEVAILRGATGEDHVRAALNVALYKRYVALGKATEVAGPCRFCDWARILRQPRGTTCDVRFRISGEGHSSCNRDHLLRESRRNPLAQERNGRE